MNRRSGSARSEDRSGQRLPTMSDVADHVGVSRQTVSLVLRGAAGPSPQSRERVLAAAAELGYRANASARLLRQKRTRLIGAFYLMRHPYESHVAEEMLERARSRGFSLALGPVTGWRTTAQAVEELLEQRVEALVGFVSEDWQEIAEKVGPRLPVVYLGGPTPGVDNVHIDDELGMRLAVDHLVELGHTRIAHLRGDDGTVGAARAAAFERAMVQAGLRPEVFGSGWSEEDGAEAGRRLLAGGDDRPTAVVCSSDMIAVGLLASLARGGMSVPEDISVIGWDDSYVASLSYHDLTSVRQEIDATADAALDMVIRRLDDPDAPVRSLLTQPRLVERSSTAPR